MKNALPALLSAIVEESFSNMTATRRVRFEREAPDEISMYEGKKSHPFARVKFEVTETFTGFHIFHSAYNKYVLLHSFNLGAPSYIELMGVLAKECDVRHPKDLSVWAIRAISQKAARIKKAANDLLALHKIKDDSDILGLLDNVEEALQEKLPTHITAFYLHVSDCPPSVEVEKMCEEFFSNLQRHNQAVAIPPVKTVDSSTHDDDDSEKCKLNDYELFDRLNTQTTEVLFGIYYAALGERACRDLKNANHPARKTRNKLIDNIIEEHTAYELMKLCEMSDDDAVYEFAEVLIS